MTQTSEYEALRSNLTHAHYLWRSYATLFTGNSEKEKLLNGVAPGFFALVHDLLIHQLVLALSKLAETRGDTLNLANLLKVQRTKLSPADAREADATLARFHAACKPIMHWRHNAIAHANFKVAIGQNPLGSLSGADVKSALELAVKFMQPFDPQPPMNWDYDSDASEMERALLAAIRARRYVNGLCHDSDRYPDLEELRQLRARPDVAGATAEPSAR